MEIVLVIFIYFLIDSFCNEIRTDKILRNLKIRLQQSHFFDEILKFLI